MDIILNNRLYKALDYIPFGAFKAIMKLQNVPEDDIDSQFTYILEFLKEVITEPKINEKIPAEDVMGLFEKMAPLLSRMKENMERTSSIIKSSSLPDSQAANPSMR